MRWFQGMAVAGIFAALVMALPAVVLSLGGEPGMALVPAVPACALLYWSLANVLNRTRIVYGSSLSVTHAPLPWPGTFEARSEEVGAFELREVRFRRRRSWGSRRATRPPRSGGRYLAELRAHVSNQIGHRDRLAYLEWPVRTTSPVRGAISSGRSPRERATARRRLAWIARKSP